ncbi:aldehyde dehydrogenase [Lentibacillus saliphilus]|uniref:aldehyde dehydrogenase n=1 Tax=Lentibacillus saliphilus TaxID=2737028 RepID=UPI001C3111DB|nr:aldehyde dehydrogenase [Lentibacillus saliphilus]
MTTIHNIVIQQHDYFHSGETRAYAYRAAQLKALRKMLKKNEPSIYQALKKDLNKSAHETLTTELGILYAEIDFTLKHLKSWMKPVKVDAPITHKGTESMIHKDPYGVCLIIAPWNYPLQLAIAPMIGAIAAGNCIVLKPSEHATATSTLLHDMITSTFDPAYITVFEGDKDVSQELMKESFDYIFFTGSTAVGKKIMQQASEQLTPVTLELGGKSPAIVDKDANLTLSAKRIAWGKYTNAGQTCVAPDYVYVHADIEKRFIKKLKKQIIALYGKQPLENDDYVKIINKTHLHRLEAFLYKGTIVHGGHLDERTEQIEPTVIKDVSWDDPIMQEEIFGPILPIMTFTELDTIVDQIARNDHPLALYYFGEKEAAQNKVVSRVQFGGGSINDTLYHLANPHLPFGGIGTSGIGAYHGKHSFDTFSHDKSIMKQTTAFDLPFRYPGSKLSHSIVKRFMK